MYREDLSNKKGSKMKTTFYKLSEALRQTNGFRRDPYEEDYETNVIFEDEMQGSVANNNGHVLEFKLLSKKYKNERGLDDWDIEILNIDEFPEVAKYL